MVSGDLRGLLECVHDARSVRLWILAPFGDAELGGVNADDAVFAHAMFVEYARDTAGHFHCVEELRLLRVIAHRRVTDRARPHGSHERTHGETLACDHVGDLLQFIVARLRVRVRQEKEVVDAREFLTIHARGGGEVEHFFEADRWFLTFGVAFTDETGPHCIVKFWKCVCHNVIYLIGAARIEKLRKIARRKCRLHATPLARLDFSTVMRLTSEILLRKIRMHSHCHFNRVAAEA